MVTPRNSHTATLLRDGTVLVAGGISNGFDAARAELYDPSAGRWTATGRMIEARYGHTATLLPDGKVLVTGGIGDQASILASAELYDPISGTWSASRAMTEARVGHTATLLSDGTVLVSGGGSYIGGNGSPLDSSERYDPATGRWTADGTMVEARFGHTATRLPGGKVLVAGGFGLNGKEVSPDSAALDSAELYNPGRRSWTATGIMGTGRAKDAAVLLPDGHVLVVGGSALAFAELYEPSTGSWAPTGTMVTPRWIGTATLLGDGKVLVTGGYGSGDALASTERYAPSSKTWTSAANMVTPRVDHTATLLRDGGLLVAGGSAGTDLTSAEIYDRRQR